MLDSAGVLSPLIIEMTSVTIYGSTIIIVPTKQIKIRVSLVTFNFSLRIKIDKIITIIPFKLRIMAPVDKGMN